jgi:cell division protein FtsL
MLKKIRLRTVFIFLLAGLSGVLLLHTSQNVQKTESELNKITAEVNREQESIRLLRTEWAYLNSPPRLETLARQYLKLEPSDPAFMKTDGQAIPAKPSDLQMEAQPVSYAPAPSAKAVPPAQKTLPPQFPREKQFNDLLNDVAGGKE